MDRLQGGGMTMMAMIETESAWTPPSATLELREGLWQPRSITKVSYPEHGNDVCLQVEDTSYWFAHRNDCILAILERFPPGGTFYDIGGGNGFVALGLQKAGMDVALLEPGSGARNARARGLNNVIWSTLEDAGFRHGTLPAAGAFDVVEHIEDDAAFLAAIRQHLQPGGRFYCTVPAGPALWSDEDIHAGHYRRYTTDTLSAALSQAGFEVEFVTYFFSWLIPLVFTLRTLPFRLRGNRAQQRGAVQAVKNDHTLPWPLRAPVSLVHAWELSRLRTGRQVSFGTSLLCVARTPHH
ncbi:MAG: class I SAM-dependent methyltransferase [Verrucomicrobiaceae bacterium]|nr:class I SAM-dependent methyltransferase [Verrucomicrobiaceae bacterium]